MNIVEVIVNTSTVGNGSKVSTVTLAEKVMDLKRIGDPSEARVD